MHKHRDRYIYLDDTLAERILREYEVLGFPGCIGAGDVVHIPWGRCPAQLASWMTGKEGFPTLAYQMVSDHSGDYFCVEHIRIFCSVHIC